MFSGINLENSGDSFLSLMEASLSCLENGADAIASLVSWDVFSPILTNQRDLVIDLREIVNSTEEDLYVPQRRTYNVQHTVIRHIRVVDSYDQELESFLDPGDANDEYVYMIESNDWFQVYNGTIIDSQEDDDNRRDNDAEFYDIYEI
jgi:hypothetical protein